MNHVGWSLISQILLASEGAKQPSIIYFDWTLIYQAGLFLLLMIFLGKVLFKPMLAVFEARESAHLGQEKLAKDLLAAAENANSAYAKIRDEALTAGERIRSEFVRDASERQRSIISDARKKADDILAEARRQLELSYKSIRDELPSRADALATQLADKLIGR